MPSFRGNAVDIVIDVRTRFEFLFGHLSGAECIPVPSLAETLGRRADVTKDTRILMYCASGARSAVAATHLQQLGYRHVVDGGALKAARIDYRAD